MTEIAQILDLTKSTVSRLMITLANEEFLEKCPDSSRYRPGLALFTLSGLITSNLEIHRESLPILKSLVSQLNETAHIAILEGTDIVYLHKVECKQPVRLQSDVGKRNPASCTSSGKVILAFSAERVVQTVIDAGLPSPGPCSVTDPFILRKQLLETRHDGFAVCIDELHEGDVSIAAPIMDFTGQVVAAVSVVGPKMRLDQSRISEFVEVIQRAGVEISGKLGYFGHTSIY